MLTLLKVDEKNNVDVQVPSPVAEAEVKMIGGMTAEEWADSFFKNASLLTPN